MADLVILQDIQVARSPENGILSPSCRLNCSPLPVSMTSPDANSQGREQRAVWSIVMSTVSHLRRRSRHAQ